MRRGLTVAVMLCLVPATLCRLAAEEQSEAVWQVISAAERASHVPMPKVRTLGDAYHPWEPPSTLAAWEKHAGAIRERVLVSSGLWPMPPKTPLEPAVHGRIDRGDYTIEKVFFASYPGHYVSGNLYRPANVHGKVPGILCPHGHWRDGRFHDAGPEEAEKQISSGAETFQAAARHPLQARMVHLARMGCTVFHYDMVGYADSQQIAHRSGFGDAHAELWLQSFLGLQTWNSIRALDFLLSLPEVDAGRVGVTGSSGGGTQTFLLSAIDPRPAVAFPAVMVSTAMQGGCVCENASFLRIGLNNIALAAAFAPKPMAMSGADDWTIEIETKGLPELKRVYSLYAKPELVYAKAFPQFGHNYNQVAREMMYSWMNEHLKLGLPESIKERDFQPVPPGELSVFDDAHPRPGDAQTAEQLREYLTRVARDQFRQLLPQTESDSQQYRAVIGTAARVLLDPAECQQAAFHCKAKSMIGQVSLEKGMLTCEAGERGLPLVLLSPPSTNGTLVIWIDGSGKSHLFDEHGRPRAAVGKLLDARMVVASADVSLTGELVPLGEGPTYPEVNATYCGYTFGYNQPVLARRVRDIVVLVQFLRERYKAARIHLVGTGHAGPWTLLAMAVAGLRPEQTIVDLGGFSFSSITSPSDPMFLPGALKYGGLAGIGALAAPARLTVAGTAGIQSDQLEPLRAMYRVCDGQLDFDADPLTPEAVAEMLIR